MSETTGAPSGRRAPGVLLVAAALCAAGAFGAQPDLGEPPPDDPGERVPGPEPIRSSDSPDGPESRSSPDHPAPLECRVPMAAGFTTPEETSRG